MKDIKRVLSREGESVVDVWFFVITELTNLDRSQIVCLDFNSNHGGWNGLDWFSFATQAYGGIWLSQLDALIGDFNSWGTNSIHSANGRISNSGLWWLKPVHWAIPWSTEHSILSPWRFQRPFHLSVLLIRSWMLQFSEASKITDGYTRGRIREGKYWWCLKIQKISLCFKVW